MESILAELPLALFTTFASVGAGAFIIAAFMQGKKQTDAGEVSSSRLGIWLPFVVALIGFCASSFHLADPLHAPFVVLGLGSSPLTNEVISGVVFMVAALVLAIMNARRASDGTLRIAGIVVAILAGVFVLCMAWAYSVPTIISWDSVGVILELIGIALAGGAVLCALTQQLHLSAQSVSGSRALLIFSVVGMVIVFVALIMQVSQISQLVNPVASGAELISHVLPFLVIGFILMLIPSVVSVVSLGKSSAITWLGMSFVVMLIGVLCVRAAFYGVYLSAGVTLL